MKNSMDFVPKFKVFENDEIHLSLAYCQLTQMPINILQGWAREIKFLDLSYNCFEDLSFLSNFSSLETLVLDRNSRLKPETMPNLNELRILWLNNCNLCDIKDWLLTVKDHCPKLEQLSMMCNPVGTTRLNGVTAAEEHLYRQQVIATLPQLSHFDGIAIAGQQNKPLSLLNSSYQQGLTLRQISNRLLFKRPME